MPDNTNEPARKVTPVKLSVEFQQPDGFVWTMEIQSEMETVPGLAAKLKAFDAMLRKEGFEPVGRSAAASAQEALARPEVSGPRTEVVEVGTLVGKYEDGTEYWKVLCPKYPLHGVRIWSEVLEVADLWDVDFRNKYELKGTAQIELKENGKPKKVLKLNLAGPPITVQPLPKQRSGGRNGSPDVF